jgi:nucleoside-diphosphate-sugar epimerase
VSPQRRSVLVTGASGFVGRAVCIRLSAIGWEVRRGPLWNRREELPSPDGWSRWADRLQGCDAVVHLAGHVHVDPRSTGDEVAEECHRIVNAHWTIMLAQAAAAAGVRRFVFASSVKAAGEEQDSPYREDDEPAPKDAYGRSKLTAEHGLAEISQSSALEMVVLRPPLVYGPGVRANFLQMMRMVDRGVPLPLAGISNRRSLISLVNFVSAIIACLEQEQAAGRTYYVSDQEDVSTPELVLKIASKLGRKSVLVPVPNFLLRYGSALFGARDAFRRLTGSLVVDSSRISEELNWRPVARLDEGLELTARWYRGCEVG